MGRIFADDLTEPMLLKSNEACLKQTISISISDRKSRRYLMKSYYHCVTNILAI